MNVCTGGIVSRAKCCVLCATCFSRATCARDVLAVGRTVAPGTCHLGTLSPWHPAPWHRYSSATLSAPSSPAAMEVRLMASFGERVVGAMTLNAATFQEIENDPTAMGQAVGVIALAAVSMGLGWIFYSGLTGIVWQILSSLVAYTIWAVFIWLFGTKVMPDPATKADFPETFRTVAFATAPGVLGIITIIPLLGWLLYFGIILWQLAAMVVAVREVLDYTDTVKAVIVVVI